MVKQNLSSGQKIRFLSYLLFVCIGAGTAVVSVFLYKYTENLMRSRLESQLSSIISTASLRFNAPEMQKLAAMGAQSVRTPEYRRTVRKLQEIKKANPDVTYAYIYSKTDNDNLVQFIADADVVALRPSLNFNEDEVTSEGFPGSTFDVSDLPNLRDGTAFQRTVVETELDETIWGTLLSAYAPIYSNGESGSILIGVDVDVTDFQRLVKTTFVPFGLFVILQSTFLAVLAIFLVRMWGSRVDFFKELDRQKDELLSIVSHQLATPVTSVKWYLEMLKNGDLGKLTKEQDEHINSMQGITVNLVDLVGMILDVSRIQLGRVQISKQNLDLGVFFKEILETVEPKATEKKVQFMKVLPSAFPAAKLDKRYTRMTIENLLTNAVKYTPSGGRVNFDVEVRGNTLWCKVQDTGCGIPKADQAKIFGKLFRASNVRNSVDGNGFGLYIAKGAVEAQGGKIWFESHEGIGTTFFVELPLS